MLTVKDILNNTNSKLLNGNVNTIVEDIIINSTQVINNSCFFGIKGNNTDGSLYYKEALEKGANVLVLSKEYEYNFKGYEDRVVIITKDTTKVLQDLAKYKRSLFKGPVIAVTGSVGKTSTKEMIASVLSQNYKVLKTKGNNNSQLGLPLTILRQKDEEVMVLEMGMSDLNHIHTLSLIAKPDIAVITNIGNSHIKYLKTKENILKAKLEIIDGMNNDKTLIINNDDIYLKDINPDINIITIGINNKSNIMASNIKENIKTTFSIRDIDNLKVNGPKNLIYNALFAYTVGKRLGLSRSMIKKGINEINNIKHRLELIKLNNNITIIDDTYNASYESIKLAINYLSKYNNRKILVLGDVLELGKETKRIHKKVAELIKSSNIDVLITIGKHSKIIGKLNKDIWLKHFRKEEKAREYIKSNIKENDVILLKGSNGMNLVNVVNYLKDE